MKLLTFNVILQSGETEQEALNYANGLDWMEAETDYQEILHSRYIDTVNGIEVYYNYGADYYFFADASYDPAR